MEQRNTIRASLGKQYAILRLPRYIRGKERENQIDKFYYWLKDKVLVEERHRRRFEGKKYEDGYTFCLYDRTYTVYFDLTENVSHSGKYLGDGEILIRLAYDCTPQNSEKEITQLISRVIAKIYTPIITDRVLAYNEQYFQREIQSVKMKYNQSNWGSCSSKANINLSTRLLFAPIEVQDYIIVHELSHLIEMNHSNRYWSIVSRVMPNYKEYEQWLKENGHQCDFGL